jgi:hypothetical protein
MRLGVRGCLVWIDSTIQNPITVTIFALRVTIATANTAENFYKLDCVDLPVFATGKNHRYSYKEIKAEQKKR